MATLNDKFDKGQTLKFKTSVRTEYTIKDGEKVWVKPSGTTIHFIVDLSGVDIRKVLRDGKDLIVKFVNNKIRPKYDGNQSALQDWAQDNATAEKPYKIHFNEIFKTDGKDRIVTEFNKLSKEEKIARIKELESLL